MVILCGIFAFFPQSVFADDQANFSVHTEPSVYQIDREKTYFDLSVPADTTIDLIVHVTNKPTIP